MEIKGKIAIITGASSGIGLATAKLFAGKGAKVVLAARSFDKLQEISRELKDSLPVRADMTVPDDIKNMFDATIEKYGHVDILVNNAGRGFYSMVESTDIENLRSIIELDLIGPVIAMQHAIPVMKKQGSGSIVNISSGTALMAIPGMAGYSSTKRALVGFSLTAREELKDDGIKVSLVYPTRTDTPFFKNALEGTGRMGSPKSEADTADHVALKILEAVESGEAEVYAHDWMKK